MANRRGRQAQAPAQAQLALPRPQLQTLSQSIAITETNEAKVANNLDKYLTLRVKMLILRELSNGQSQFAVSMLQLLRAQDTTMGKLYKQCLLHAKLHNSLCGEHSLVPIPRRIYQDDDQTRPIVGYEFFPHFPANQALLSAMSMDDIAAFCRFYGGEAMTDAEDQHAKIDKIRQFVGLTAGSTLREVAVTVRSLKADMQEMQTEMQALSSQVQAVQTEMQAMRSDVRSEIQALRTDMQAILARLPPLPQQQ